MSDFRVTDKDLFEFANELGFRLQGRVGSRVIVAGDGSRTVHGPCSTRENVAYLRGVRDVRAGYVPNYVLTH